jgi:hypothetical protein
MRPPKRFSLFSQLVMSVIKKISRQKTGWKQVGFLTCRDWEILRNRWGEGKTFNFQ